MVLSASFLSSFAGHSLSITEPSTTATFGPDRGAAALGAGAAAGFDSTGEAQALRKTPARTEAAFK
jgi:hypothetical protein